ncbi:MAG: DnaA regulatory inactivator Hda [Burkholderiaceae bacterium]|nr:DnaA regulatory inactivator Hda [Burkholderiaceae bacterium]
MAQQLILDILPSSEPTFDNMVPGANAAALAAAHNLTAGSTLYVWGPDGSGRSHLLRACANRYEGAYIDANASVASPADAMAALLDAPNMPRCVAVDDIHRLDEPALAAVFGLYNRWREFAASQEAFRLIVAGDRAPLQMPIREDVRTRLGWGAVYRLEPLTDEDKFAALIGYAHERGMPLSEDVLRWLLVHGSRDIRALFAMLDALDRFALANHRPLTLPLLKSMMAQKPVI